jgi:hypothetical protein
MTPKDCPGDLETFLNGQTLASVTLASNSNLFSYDAHPMPNTLVVRLNNAGGDFPEPLITTARKALIHADVGIIIHGMAGYDGHVQGEALAYAVWGYLQQAVPSGYIDVLMRESSPTHVGLDPVTQRNLWTMTAVCRYIAS